MCKLLKRVAIELLVLGLELGLFLGNMVTVTAAVLHSARPEDPPALTLQLTAPDLPPVKL